MTNTKHRTGDNRSATPDVLKHPLSPVESVRTVSGYYQLFPINYNFPNIMNINVAADFVRGSYFV